MPLALKQVGQFLSETTSTLQLRLNSRARYHTPVSLLHQNRSHTRNKPPGYCPEISSGRESPYLMFPLTSMAPGNHNVHESRTDTIGLSRKWLLPA